MSATGSRLKRALKYLSVAYVLLLAASFVALLLLDLLQGVERTELGCFFQSALINAVRCEGFIGAEAVPLILNLPYWLFYAPLFGVGMLKWKGLTSESLLLLLFALGLWSPIAYALWNVRYGKLGLIALALGITALTLEETGVF